MSADIALEYSSTGTFNNTKFTLLTFFFITLAIMSCLLNGITPATKQLSTACYYTTVNIKAVIFSTWARTSNVSE